MTSGVHTCPSCELRFAWSTELEDHLYQDHPEHRPVRAGPTSPTPRRAAEHGVLVVPIDPDHGPTSALTVAGAIAGSADMSIELVAAPTGGEPVEMVTARLAAEAAHSALGGMPATFTALPAGDPVVAILDHVAFGHADLLCLSTRIRHAPSELFGSVASELAHRSPVPVVVVGPHAAPTTEIRRIVVCLDGGDVAAHALVPAHRLAALLGVELDLVQVVRDDDVDSSYLRSVAGRLEPAPHAYSTVHHRHPATGIIEHVRNDPSTLVALGVHDRGALLQHLSVGIVPDVVRHAVGPVLLVPERADAGLASLDPARTPTARPHARS